MDEQLQRVVDDLASLAALPVILETADLRLVAFSSHSGNEDEVRGASILSRAASADVRAHVLRYVRGATRPTRIPGNTRLRMDERLCIPISHADGIVGYAWFVDPDRVVTESQIAQCEQVATGAADHLARLERNRLSDPPRVFAALLRDPDSAPTDQLDERRTKPYAVAALAHAGPHAIESRTIERATREALTRLRLVGAIDVVAVLHEDTCALYLSARDRERALRALGDILQETARLLCQRGLDARIVAAVSRERMKARHARRAWTEASRLLRAVRTFPELGPVVTHESLGGLELAVEAADSSASLHPGLSALAEDADGGALLRTVEVYLDTAGNAQTSAHLLNLHRTSLYHRLSRIERLAGVDLKDGGDRLALHLSIKVARLRGEWPALLSLDPHARVSAAS